MQVTDFSWVDMQGSEFWGGMYTKHKGDAPPKEFEPFEFYIEKAPTDAFDIFHIPANIMFKAGYAAGFGHVDFTLQYPDPAHREDPVIRRYIDTCDPPDYVMKFKFAKKWTQKSHSSMIKRHDDINLDH